jgi:DNA-binding CsgD family transcriptional regulator/PAS domain-containing protein
MGLMLSSSDEAKLEATLATLLSPLDSPTPEAWRALAGQKVRDLLGAEKSVFVIPAESAPLLSDEVESSALEAYLRHFSAMDVGLQRQRELGLEVWSVLQLVKPESHRRTEIWNDWKAPNGLWGATGISVQPEGVPAGIICYDPREDPVLEERQVALLNLVKPAFLAGVRTSHRMAARRSCLAQAFDTLIEAIGLYDLHGRLLHANPALLRLLNAEPQRERLVEQVQATVSDLGMLAARRTKSRDGWLLSPRIGETEASGYYRVTGSYLVEDLFGPDTTVLVSIETLRPPLPSEESLRARFPLTRREAAVVLLLVQGMTNDEIAARLHISTHTARHHTENVFLKLNVHSRAELARRIRSS